MSADDAPTLSTSIASLIDFLLQTQMCVSCSVAQSNLIRACRLPSEQGRLMPRASCRPAKSKSCWQDLYCSSRHGRTNGRMSPKDYNRICKSYRI
jgi:hypothetical protein